MQIYIIEKQLHVRLKDAHAYPTDRLRRKQLLETTMLNCDSGNGFNLNQSYVAEARKLAYRLGLKTSTTPAPDGTVTFRVFKR